MSNDFHINEDVLNDATEDFADEKVTELVQEIEARKIRLLAYAFVAGYDGVDVHMEPQTDWKDTLHNFNTSLKYEVWESKPPDLGIAPRGVHRYDFRTLSRQEKRELIAHIGLAELPEGVDNNE